MASWLMAPLSNCAGCATRGSAHHWGFAIYRASHDDYQESIFPTGQTRRHCEDALDTACGLYLGDRTTWT
jgi:hypothetical protein